MSEGITVSRALDRIARNLSRAGIPNARREARLLIGHVLDVGADTLFLNLGRRLRRREGERLDDLAGRRSRRQPMAQILGRREFWGLPFRVTGATLDPRPDSETLIEAVLELAVKNAAPQRVLDLGMGTGCLLLALLSELPGTTGLGVDISEAACKVARSNAAALGMRERATFVVGDWGRSLEGQFEVIMANPPYVSEEGLAGLEKEVAVFEPRLALAAGADGLACYRDMMADVKRLLSPAGMAFLEIGAGQAPAVRRILADHGLTVFALRKDLAGIERCVIASHADR